MIDPATGELSFNGGRVKVGPATTLKFLGSLPDAEGPALTRAMTTKLLSGLESFPGEIFSACLDFLDDKLTSVRLMAKDPKFPPNLKDWDLEREMARHDYHCLWIRRQLGWLWRLRRFGWGRAQALCGRNLDKTPRESIIKVVYVEFSDVEAAVAREFSA